jgi:ribosomal protein S27AE
MPAPLRFQDEHKTLASFFKEVWVVCPACNKQAFALADFDKKIARLFCDQCGYAKEVSTCLPHIGKNASLQMAAHAFFDAELWLQLPFKNEVFWAYNPAHLIYLEKYIGASLREHKDRTHFTLLEKLPKFYHEAKNRATLLRVIAKLKKFS